MTRHYGIVSGIREVQDLALSRHGLDGAFDQAKFGAIHHRWLDQCHDRGAVETPAVKCLLVKAAYSLNVATYPHTLLVDIRAHVKLA